MVSHFEETYFKKLYADGETIDGDFNSKDHALYLKYLFQLMGYHPKSVFDFGFGKGTLLKSISQSLEIYYVGGCDVSIYAYQKLKRKKFAKDWKLKNCSIKDLKNPRKPYSLGLCNSVIQYLPLEKDVEFAVRKMNQMCKYVYLHVPTLEDYKILKSQLKFEDPYAFKRSNEFYKKSLSKYFYFVSWGLLESKLHSNHKNSVFSDSIYRS